MSDPDPLRLGGLDSKSIEQAVDSRKKKPESEEAKIRAATNAKREERLQNKEKGGPSVDAPSAPPPPPPVDKSALLDKIGAYRDRFPDLKSRNKLSAKSSVEEIEDELHYIEGQLGSSGGSMSGTIFVASMTALEHITARHFNPLGLNLTGLSNVASSNVLEVEPIIDELMIKYGASFYMSPEMRLVTTVGMMVYTVHAANSGDPTTLQAMKKMQAPAGSKDL